MALKETNNFYYGFLHFIKFNYHYTFCTKFGKCKIFRACFSCEILFDKIPTRRKVFPRTGSSIRVGRRGAQSDRTK